MLCRPTLYIKSKKFCYFEYAFRSRKKMRFEENVLNKTLQEREKKERERERERENTICCGLGNAFKNFQSKKYYVRIRFLQLRISSLNHHFTDCFL